MTRLVVRWRPPYSSGFKDQPCTHLHEAELLRDWLRNSGAEAEIVKITEVEEAAGRL